MAVLLGGAIGSFIGMLIICYFVFKFGPNKRSLNLLFQAIITGVITYYLSTDHSGIHYRIVDVMANWIGWGIALIAMFFFTAKKININLPENNNKDQGSQ